MKSLTSGERHLLENQGLLKEMIPQRRGSFFRDIRKKAKTELGDLAVLAKTLPEKQQSQVFTHEQLQDFFDSLFLFSGEKTGKDLEKRRKRILQIFEVLFSRYIANTEYVLRIANAERKIISSSQSAGNDMLALMVAAERTRS